jgi:putative tricarboxylic transport membrane protein
MKRFLCLLTLSTAIGSAVAGPLDKSECIAAAKPGGGFDLTCKLAQSALMDTGILKDPMRVTYMPGGIGAVAYNAIIAQRPAEPNAIVAFSGGSLLNIAQGKFGRYTENDVRWLAAVGADYGAVIVRKDSPFQTLQDLAGALKADSKKVVLGAGGTVGSQDWMKAALTAKAAGVNHKTMRFVAFEGGGEAIAALQGGHIHAYFGDAGEAASQTKAGANIRVLAVMSEKRLPGAFANIPTAKEQGFDVEWPIVRGFYMGPKVSDADFQVWTDAFNKLTKTKEFAKLVDDRGLYPFFMTGPELDAYVKRATENYRKLANDFGLMGSAK